MTQIIQGIKKTDNRTDSRNGASRKNPVTTGWMRKRGMAYCS